MDAIPYIDELINEYLLFRGFIKTFTHFNTEKQTSGTSLNIPADVDALTELILGHVRALELQEFQEVWATLRSKFFIHLEQPAPSASNNGPSLAPPSYEPLIRSMEISLKKAILVKAHTRKRMDKIRECFEKLQGEMLAGGGGNAASGASGGAASDEWQGWFALAYVTDPATHPLFAPFFHRRWMATLATSLHNFLSTLFRTLPLPRILGFNLERERRKKAAQEIRQLKAELEKTKSELASTSSELTKMKNQGYRIFQRGSTIQQSQQTAPSTGTTPAPDAVHQLTPPSLSDPQSVPTTSLTAATSAAPLDPAFAISSSSILTLNDSDSATFELESTQMLFGHSGPVLKTRFSTEGNFLATLSTNSLLDTTVASSSELAQSKIWNLETVLEKHRLAVALREEALIDKESLPLPPSSTLSFQSASQSSTPNSSTRKLKPNTTQFKTAPGGFLSPSTKPQTLATRSRKTSLDDASNYILPTSSSTDDADDDHSPLAPTHTISHTTPLSTFTFSKTDRYLITGSGSDGRIGVWNLVNGTAPKLMTELNSSDSVGGSPCPVILDLVTSPGDRFLVSAAASKMHCECGSGSNAVISSSQLQGVLEMYDLATGKRDIIFHASNQSSTSGQGQDCSQVNSVVLNHNGNMLIAGGADGLVRVFDTRTSQPMIGWSAHALSAVSCLRLSADETTVISAGLDGTLIQWSLHRMGKVVRELRMPTSSHPSSSESYSSSIQFLSRPEFALDPTSNFALLSEGFGWRSSDTETDPSTDIPPSAYIYALTRPDPIQILRGHAGPVLSVDWHPSSQLCVTSSVDHTARLMTLREKPLKTISTT